MRNQQIDLIRGVSILLVLLNHFDIAYRLEDTLLAQAFGRDAVQAIARNGSYGVTMFFVISGYLITSNADRRWTGLANIDGWTFYGMRVARILPCLLLLLVMVNLLALGGVPIFQNHVQRGPPPPFWLVNLAALTFWMNVLIGRDGWFNYPLGVLWSLSVEEVFYLAFPLLCAVLRREMRLLMFWAAIIVVGPFYRLAHQGDEVGFLYAYFACFDGIAIGCCTALLAKRVSLCGRGLMVMQILTAIGMTFLYLWRPIGQTNVLGVTVMALGTGLLLFGASRHSSSRGIARIRVLLAIGWIGKRSYELYLFHLIVLGTIRTIFPPRNVAGDEKLLALAAFLILSTGLAALISRVYSEPLNRGIRQIVSRRPVETLL